MINGYETVKDVLADMKKRSENANGIANDNPDATTHCDALAVMLDNFRYRIEAAHQREIDELTAAEHGGVIVNGAVRGLKTENESLRAALKRIAEYCLQFTAKQMMFVNEIATEALKGDAE